MFSEYYIYNQNFTLTGGTGVLYTMSSLLINDNADFVLKRTSHIATSNVVNLKLKDLSTGRFLFKTQEDLRTISGTSLNSITANGFLPYNWPIPYQINKSKQVETHISDASGIGNTVRLAFHGDAVYENNPYKEYNPTDKQSIMPYVYETNTIVPASALNATAEYNLQINNDADFVCTKITGLCTDVGLVEIKTYSTGIASYWQNIPTHTNNLFGNSQFPNMLTSPRYIKRNTSISVVFTSLIAGANSLTLQFHGYKKF